MSPKPGGGSRWTWRAARAGRIFLCRPGCRRQGRAHPGETRRNLYDGVPLDEVFKAAILAARTLIEKEPAYTRATARLLLHTIRREILGEEVTQAQMSERYSEYFAGFIKKGVKAELLDEKLLQFDLARLGAAIDADRDLQFDYLQACRPIYDRYFLAHDERRIELPRSFFMRVAMVSRARRDRPRGAGHRVLRSALVVRLHELDSRRSSTRAPARSQLSSCYLTTVSDDLDGIYEALKENALLSSSPAASGNDWTNVRRARAANIKGTNGKSQGVGAVPQGGERHGGRRQPGRQAQGRGLRLSGVVAPRPGRVSRAAQEHRRRPPAHARHEHRQLDPRPVHAAGRRRWRLDAVLTFDLP
jgi:hypothetical protein